MAIRGLTPTDGHIVEILLIAGKPSSNGETIIDGSDLRNRCAQLKNQQERGRLNVMKKIGTSDLEVSPLCLGGNTFGWTASGEESFAVLDRFVEAIDRGTNC